MTMVKASIKIVGSRSSAQGIALVDTGASLTLVDEEVANEVGVRYLGRVVRVVVADGHEVQARLAVVDKLIVEGEELLYAHVAVLRFTEKLRERLRSLGLADWCVIGVTTLELLQLVPDPTTGRLRKSSALLL